ncbi:7798_t:CDS:2 [Paraglomus occultum]|uniref:7798_t:CDS:1 n=1 Tax=Paraglomus occultum TaxID=144539 RepID=A0A9N9DEE6_9GLOM|nr:7798_t:CDS:2 [Paraglomus occultum]
MASLSSQQFAVPSDFQTWTEDDVIAHMRNTIDGFKDSYAKILKDNELRGEFLSGVTVKILTAAGMPFGPAIGIKREIDHLLGQRGFPTTQPYQIDVLTHSPPIPPVTTGEAISEITRGVKQMIIDEALAPDLSGVICKKLLQPFEIIPKQANDLLNLIKAPLLQELPAASGEEIRHPILEGFIKTETSTRGSILAVHVSMALSNAVAEDALGPGSEDLKHWALDTLVRKPLQLFKNQVGSMLPIFIDRNQKDSQSTTVGSNRPDVLLQENNVLIFKAEEKGQMEDFGKAVTELTKKFNTIDPLAFGSVQFMICYAAAGPLIRFYALDASQSNTNTAPTTTLLELTDRLDISTLNGRKNVLHTVINIARILVTIRDQLHDNAFPIGKIITTDKSTIVFEDILVIKTIPEKALPYGDNPRNRTKFLQKMYICALNVPGLVQIDEEPKFFPKPNGKGFYQVKLVTQGVQRLPRDENELCEMTKSILTGLVKLHQGGFVHCDIRLPNIVYDNHAQDGYKYILIDFEHGLHAGTHVNITLNEWDENTLDHGKYKPSSDMYQLGKLLENFSSKLSANGKDFVDKLKGKKTSAQNALLHSWISS